MSNKKLHRPLILANGKPAGKGSITVKISTIFQRNSCSLYLKLIFFLPLLLAHTNTHSNVAVYYDGLFPIVVDDDDGDEDGTEAAAVTVPVTDGCCCCCSSC